jgi:hypothetical protein
MVQPLITHAKRRRKNRSLGRPTRALLYVGSVNRYDQDRINIRFRLETAAGISAQPTYVPPDAPHPARSRA